MGSSVLDIEHIILYPTFGSRQLDGSEDKKWPDSIFRGSPATDSNAKRPPIPREGDRGIEGEISTKQNTCLRSRRRLWLVSEKMEI